MSLYNLAMECKFTEAFNRVRSHPEEAEFRNDNNWVTLHILVWKEAPLSTVKAVYKAYPAGLQVRSKRGETPLDMAEKNNADEKIVSFLKASEYAQMRDSVLNLSLLQSSFTEIQKTCESLVHDNKILKDRCEDLSKGNESLLQQDLIKTEAITKDRHVLEAEILTMKNNFAELSEKSCNMEKNADEMKAENEQLRLDCSLLKDENEKLKDEMDKIRADNEARCNECRTLNEESEVLKKTVGSLLGTCNHLSKDNEALKNACNEISRRNDSYIVSLKENTRALESKISRMQIDSNEKNKKRDLFVAALQTLICNMEKELKNNSIGRKEAPIPGSPQTTACEL